MRIAMLDTRKPVTPEWRTMSDPQRGTLWRVYIPETMQMPAHTYVVRHADESREVTALTAYNRARVRAGVRPISHLPALTVWVEITDHNVEIGHGR